MQCASEVPFATKHDLDPGKWRSQVINDRILDSLKDSVADILNSEDEDEDLSNLEFSYPDAASPSETDASAKTVLQSPTSQATTECPSVDDTSSMLSAASLQPHSRQDHTNTIVSDKNWVQSIEYDRPPQYHSEPSKAMQPHDLHNPPVYSKSAQLVNPDFMSGPLPTLSLTNVADPCFTLFPPGKELAFFSQSDYGHFVPCPPEPYGFTVPSSLPPSAFEPITDPIDNGAHRHKRARASLPNQSHNVARIRARIAGLPPPVARRMPSSVVSFPAERMSSVGSHTHDLQTRLPHQRVVSAPIAGASQNSARPGHHLAQVGGVFKSQSRPSAHVASIYGSQGNLVSHDLYTHGPQFPGTHPPGGSRHRAPFSMVPPSRAQPVSPNIPLSSGPFPHGLKGKGKAIPGDGAETNVLPTVPSSLPASPPLFAPEPFPSSIGAARSTHSPRGRALRSHPWNSSPSLRSRPSAQSQPNAVQRIRAAMNHHPRSVPRGITEGTTVTFIPVDDLAATAASTADVANRCVTPGCLRAPMTSLGSWASKELKCTSCVLKYWSTVSKSTLGRQLTLLRIPPLRKRPSTEAKEEVTTSKDVVVNSLHQAGLDLERPLSPMSDVSSGAESEDSSRSGSGSDDSDSETLSEGEEGRCNEPESDDDSSTDDSDDHDHDREAEKPIYPKLFIRIRRPLPKVEVDSSPLTNEPMKSTVDSAAVTEAAAHASADLRCQGSQGEADADMTETTEVMTDDSLQPPTTPTASSLSMTGSTSSASFGEPEVDMLNVTEATTVDSPQLTMHPPTALPARPSATVGPGSPANSDAPVSTPATVYTKTRTPPPDGSPCADRSPQEPIIKCRLPAVKLGLKRKREDAVDTSPSTKIIIGVAEGSVSANKETGGVLGWDLAGAGGISQSTNDTKETKSLSAIEQKSERSSRFSSMEVTAATRESVSAPVPRKVRFAEQNSVHIIAPRRPAAQPSRPPRPQFSKLPRHPVPGRRFLHEHVMPRARLSAFGTHAVPDSDFPLYQSLEHLVGRLSHHFKAFHRSREAFLTYKYLLCKREQVVVDGEGTGTVKSRMVGSDGTAENDGKPGEGQKERYGIVEHAVAEMDGPTDEKGDERHDNSGRPAEVSRPNLPSPLPSPTSASSGAPLILLAEPLVSLPTVEASAEPPVESALVVSKSSVTSTAACCPTAAKPPDPGDPTWQPPPLLFAFDGSFSITVPQSDMLSRVSDIRMGIEKLRLAIQEALDLKLKSIKSSADRSKLAPSLIPCSCKCGHYALVARFECMRQVFLPTSTSIAKIIPRAKAAVVTRPANHDFSMSSADGSHESPLLKDEEASLRKVRVELEIVVLNDFSHQLFSGQKTVVRMRELG